MEVKYVHDRGFDRDVQQSDNILPGITVGHYRPSFQTMQFHKTYYKVSHDRLDGANPSSMHYGALCLT